MVARFDVQMLYEIEEEVNIVSLLKETAIFLWKDWPMDMELAHLEETSFVLRGTCPHCGFASNFPTITKLFGEEYGGEPNRLVAVGRCIGCREYILAIIKTQTRLGSYTTDWVYETHYPLGEPNDSVDEEIPENIRNDFSEALRCQWVNAYNATAEMCRRTVESSCIQLGAPYSKVLQEMIDWLKAKGIITEALQNVAHKVRLGGDRAAHPPEDPTIPPKYEPMIVIGEDHANAIIQFTRHFLDHVYVIPKRLPNFDYEKPKKL